MLLIYVGEEEILFVLCRLSLTFCPYPAGSAYNQAGRSSGLTAPNGPAQTALVRSALQVAGKQPHDVSMLSLHGTGTPLGDPIEVGALGQALASSQDHCLTLGTKTHYQPGFL